MLHIRKYIAGLAALGFILFVTKPVHAFSTKGKTELTASVITGGVATIAITSALIKNRTNNTVAGALGWTNTAAGWQVSDQYIELVTNINTTSGGVQIYTDNVNANPSYTGAINSNSQSPAGLVNNSIRTEKLPTAWRASTGTVESVLPVNPNAGAGDSFLWFFHEDKSQVANIQNGANYADGDPFITIYAAPGTTLTTGSTLTSAPVSYAVPAGVHFAQGPQQFGGFSNTATTYIYTEADFSSALAATTYSTNKLVLEAFSL